MNLPCLQYLYIYSIFSATCSLYSMLVSILLCTSLNSSPEPAVRSQPEGCCRDEEESRMTLLISEKGSHMTLMVRAHLSTGELDRKHGFKTERGFYTGSLDTLWQRGRGWKRACLTLTLWAVTCCADAIGCVHVCVVYAVYFISPDKLISKCVTSRFEFSSYM